MVYISSLEWTSLIIFCLHFSVCVCVCEELAKENVVSKKGPKHVIPVSIQGSPTIQET